MSASPENLCALLRSCEDRLLHGDPEEAAALLAADFEEVGPDGRCSSREAVLRWLSGRERSQRWHFLDFVVLPLTENLALVRYLARREGAREGGSRRVSLWERRGASWQLRFHQATRISAALLSPQDTTGQGAS